MSSNSLWRQFDGQSLVIASHNRGKIDDIKLFFGGLIPEIVSASELGLEEPEETGKTLIANAELKARQVALASKLSALADDTGLFVTALSGAPGIYSARWAGNPRDFACAMARVERELHGSADRSAYFGCALALSWPDGYCESVEAHMQGELVWPARGQHGFGYDPVFLPLGQTLTFGEMEPEHKRRLSHRTIALRLIYERCFAAAERQRNRDHRLA